MNPALYILSEGELDEVFYERLCERLTGLSFQKIEEFRYSPGDNWNTVFRLARLALKKVSYHQNPQETAVLIAMDNDRAPGHPGGRRYPRNLPAFDKKKAARYPALRQMVEKELGPEPAQRNVQAVIALPVEMIESWLLLLLDPARDEATLPLFSEAESSLALQYYNNHPPPQLKDEAVALRHTGKQDKFAQFFEAADTGDLDRLTEASPSFALFRGEVEVLRDLWNPPAPA